MSAVIQHLNSKLRNVIAEGTYWFFVTRYSKFCEKHFNLEQNCATAYCNWQKKSIFLKVCDTMVAEMLLTIIEVDYIFFISFES